MKGGGKIMENVYYKIIHYTDSSYYEGMGYDSEGEFIYHGEGKLYHANGNIAYEGCFSNGVFHGMGQEYYTSGKLRYKGSFLNGKLHGNGIAFHLDGLIISYQGDFEDGKFHGMGKMYDLDGKLWYEGDFFHGCRHGSGRMYSKNGNLYYEGDFKDGKRNGKGREYNQDGILIYEGIFVDDKMMGWGKKYSPDGTLLYKGFFLEYYRYDGEFVNGMPNGSGRLYFDDTLIYEGGFVDGKRTGKGKCYFADGTTLYEGELLDNYMHGQGIRYAEDGSVVHQGYFIRNFYYEGEFLDGKPHGEGILRSDDGTIYEGHFANGLEHGEGRQFSNHFMGEVYVIYEGLFKEGRRSVGTSYTKDGTILYQGEYDGFTPCGNGKFFYKNGILEYQGEVRSTKNGKGKEYYEDGQLAYAGEFLRGCRSGEGKEYNKNGILVYSGTYVKGYWEGDGVLYDDKGVRIIYKGEFHKGTAWGHGILYREDGTPEFTGKFVDGKPIGHNLSRPAEIRSINADVKTYESNNANQSELLRQYCQELECMIGLKEVKSKINSLINLAKMRRIRDEMKLPNPIMSYHLVFTGNPGTGKTTIARLLAKIYFQIGITSKDIFVEVDRTQLVGEYIGHSEAKTNKVIQSARGGVLFIDEAYALARKDGIDKIDPFGEAVIDCLIKRMEDYRNDLIVIVAGYQEEMERFIKSNPGLESRFKTYIHFTDYSASELADIFDSICTQFKYRIHPNAREALMDLFEKARYAENFSNARYARNLFEKMLEALAERLSPYHPGALSDKQLQEFTIQDVRFVSAHDMR